MQKTENPYEAARGVFYDRYMVLSKAVRHWQLATFALLAVLVCLSALSLYLARSQRLVPYVIERDGLGRTRYAGALEAADLEQDELIAAQLASVITNLRTIYRDAAAQTDMINEAYRFVTPEAARFLSNYFAEHNPIELSKRLIRRVEIEHVIRVPGSDSWNLAWRESEILTLDGSRTESAWQAYVTLAFQAPADEASARANPLGMFISAINWSKQV